MLYDAFIDRFKLNSDETYESLIEKINNDEPVYARDFASLNLRWEFDIALELTKNLSDEDRACFSQKESPSLFNCIYVVNNYLVLLKRRKYSSYGEDAAAQILRFSFAILNPYYDYAKMFE